MEKKLVDRLKLALGRQLSPEQMANARGESEVITIVAGSDKPMKIDRLEKCSSDKFVRFRQRFSFMTTPDASYGWERPHKGYYPSRTVVEKYNEGGLLVVKQVSDGNLYILGKTVTGFFNPPGKLIGKRGESSRGFLLG